MNTTNSSSGSLFISLMIREFLQGLLNLKIFLYIHYKSNWLALLGDNHLRPIFLD
ncbi:MAG TPA: hypothetical protein VLH40_07345 [Atribacteraceae bacterium]|nr:hypothetical protein [Atribacteraceae bacterium]